jgi:inhibitor of KinA
LFSNYTIYCCGDHAATISFGDTIEPSINDKVFAVFQQLKALNLDGVTDVIPAYTTVTVVYDIEKIKTQTSKTAYSFICDKIRSIIDDAAVSGLNKLIMEIPVCYDKDFGIDLEKVAQHKQISIDEIIQIHTSKTYHVYMVGFLPGFAYMGIVDERISTPRLTTPRTNVEAGCVGIAGNQTGIYPLDSPGGWNIVGKTPVQLFDAGKEQPCLLQPGNIVKFISITREKFDQLKQA